jgi:hypothetical protein
VQHFPQFVCVLCTCTAQAPGVLYLSFCSPMHWLLAMRCLKPHTTYYLLSLL